MSLPPHLVTYNGYYYYQAKVPVDLRHFFPCTFIKKSLRTKKITDARQILISVEYKVSRTFTYLRTGMLTDDLARNVVDDLLQRKKVEVKSDKHLLSGIIKQYIPYSYTFRCKADERREKETVGKWD